MSYVFYRMALLLLTLLDLDDYLSYFNIFILIYRKISIGLCMFATTMLNDD